MFDKFGEFDSAEEINRAAAAQMAEGDTAAVMAIAEENGIDKEDAQDYIDGVIAELTTPLLAAYGKIDVEAKNLKVFGPLKDWADMVREACTTSSDLQIAVRRKGKSLVNFLGKILETSFKDKKQVDKSICQAAGLTGNQPVYIGMPDRKQVRSLMLEYYIGGKK